jgi:hypothetical protein
MVGTDPSDPSQQIMVLVDKASGAVFSGMDRAESGDMIQIGRLIDGDVILDDRIEIAPSKATSASGSDKGELSIFFTYFVVLSFYAQQNACIEADVLALRGYSTRCIFENGVSFGQYQCNNSLN